jgi:hypothetical protein
MGWDQLADGIHLPLIALGLIVVADCAIGLLSPTLLLHSYARQVAGWVGPRIPAVIGIGLRIGAALAIAAACAFALSLNGSTWDLGELIMFGMFGVICKMFDWNRLMLILPLAYGPLLEENIRRAMLISNGDPGVFIRSPFSGILLLLAGGILAVVALLSARRALFPRRSAV